MFLVQHFSSQFPTMISIIFHLMILIELHAINMLRRSTLIWTSIYENSSHVIVFYHDLFRTSSQLPQLRIVITSSNFSNQEHSQKDMKQGYKTRSFFTILASRLDKWVFILLKKFGGSLIKLFSTCYKFPLGQDSNGY